MRGTVAKRLRRVCRIGGTFNEKLYKALKREHQRTPATKRGLGGIKLTAREV